MPPVEFWGYLIALIFAVVAIGIVSDWLWPTSEDFE